MCMSVFVYTYIYIYVLYIIYIHTACKVQFLYQNPSLVHCGWMFLGTHSCIQASRTKGKVPQTILDWVCRIWRDGSKPGSIGTWYWTDSAKVDWRVEGCVSSRNAMWGWDWRPKSCEQLGFSCKLRKEMAVQILQGHFKTRRLCLNHFWFLTITSGFFVLHGLKSSSPRRRSSTTQPEQRAKPDQERKSCSVILLKCLTIRLSCLHTNRNLN